MNKFLLPLCFDLRGTVIHMRFYPRFYLFHLFLLTFKTELTAGRTKLQFCNSSTLLYNLPASLNFISSFHVSFSSLKRKFHAWRYALVILIIKSIALFALLICKLFFRFWFGWWRHELLFFVLGQVHSSGLVFLTLTMEPLVGYFVYPVTFVHYVYTFMDASVFEF